MNRRNHLVFNGVDSSNLGSWWTNIRDSIVKKVIPDSIQTTLPTLINKAIFGKSSPASASPVVVNQPKTSSAGAAASTAASSDKSLFNIKLTHEVTTDPALQTAVQDAGKKALYIGGGILAAGLLLFLVLRKSK